MAILATALSLASGNAVAGWTFIGDGDGTDTATNPGVPHDQNPSTIGDYLQDLLNLSTAPNLLPQSGSFDGAVLTGIGNPSTPDRFLLAFHFGNGNDYWADKGNAFFSCVSDCDSFTPPTTKAVGHFLLYSTGSGPLGPSVDPQGPAPVPEPASLALVALGLASLGASRARRGRPRD